MRRRSPRELRACFLCLSIPGDRGDRGSREGLGVGSGGVATDADADVLAPGAAAQRPAVTVDDLATIHGPAPWRRVAWPRTRWPRRRAHPLVPLFGRSAGSTPTTTAHYVSGRAAGTPPSRRGHDRHRAPSAGYDTLFTGKYINGYGRNGTELDVPIGWTDRPVRRSTRRRTGSSAEDEPQRQARSVPGDTPPTTAHAQEMISAERGDRPWFAGLRPTWRRMSVGPVGKAIRSASTGAPRRAGSRRRCPIRGPRPLSQGSAATDAELLPTATRRLLTRRPTRDASTRLGGR